MPLRFVVVRVLSAIVLIASYVCARTAQQEADQTQAASADKPQFPSGKFSGLMFGDYYWYYRWHQDQISSSNPTDVQGQQGLWFRRLYLTYDWSYNERLTTRLRLEANSDGQFEGGNLEPYVKDAYLRWTYRGRQQLTLGLQPTLAFDWLEGFWGLRHIEKTPADLYRIEPSRDFGVTVSGPLPVDGLQYAVQFGNDSGTGSEVDVNKAVRIEGRYERKSGLALEGFYGYSSRPAGEDRQTAQGFAGFRRESRAARRSVSVAGATVGSGRCARSDDRRAIGVLRLGHQACEGGRIRPHRSRQWRARRSRDRLAWG